MTVTEVRRTAGITKLCVGTPDQGHLTRKLRTFDAISLLFCLSTNPHNETALSQHSLQQWSHSNNCTACSGGVGWSTAWWCSCSQCNSWAFLAASSENVWDFHWVPSHHIRHSELSVKGRSWRVSGFCTVQRALQSGNEPVCSKNGEEAVLEFGVHTRDSYFKGRHLRKRGTGRHKLELAYITLIFWRDLLGSYAKGTGGQRGLPERVQAAGKAPSRGTCSVAPSHSSTDLGAPGP